MGERKMSKRGIAPTPAEMERERTLAQSAQGGIPASIAPSMTADRADVHTWLTERCGECRRNGNCQKMQRAMMMYILGDYERPKNMTDGEPPINHLGHRKQAECKRFRK
jgi:hypothetical protein